MKILLITFAAFLIMQVSWAQDWGFSSPDYESIKSNIEVAGTNLHYPAIFQRYMDGDTSMTLTEKRNVYYGYIFQPAYSPYGISAFMDSLNYVMGKGDLTKGDVKKISAFSDSLLLENSFNLDAINYKLFATEQLGEMEEYNHFISKMTLILDAILSTGTGISEEEAFYVTHTSHEYAILQVLGFQYDNSQSLNGNYDELKVKVNPAGIDFFYFDVSPCLEHLSQLIKDK